MRQYGDKLVCVRYRYDEALRKRLKTVELKIDEVPWRPEANTDDIVSVRVKWNEKNVQEQVRKAGGRWDKERKIWKIRHEKVKELGMAARIADCGKGGMRANAYTGICNRGRHW